MPNIKPILFSGEMVRAILEGRKTQTRRIIKQQLPIGTIWHQLYDSELLYRIVDSKAVHTLCKCPYEVGDILWVRETWCDYGNSYAIKELKYDGHYLYKADGDFQTAKIWKPSIFMPKDACRLFLKVTNVKVERLQEISHADIINEGVKIQKGDDLWQKHFGDSPKHFGDGSAVVYSKLKAFFDELGKCILYADYEAWKRLWVKINGHNSWDSNPYVWVVSFKITDRPEGFIKAKEFTVLEQD